jgi:hypothetical protein
MEVEAEERFRKDMHMLEVDHPDPLGLWIPEKVVESDVRVTKDAILGFKVDSVVKFDPSRPTRQCLSRKQRETGRGY